MHECKIIGISKFAGSGWWQVTDIDIKEKRSQDRSLWDTILQASEFALLSITGREGEATVLNKFHDHLYQVSVRNKPQKLAGQAAMPHGVLGCSEIH